MVLGVLGAEKAQLKTFCQMCHLSAARQLGVRWHILVPDRHWRYCLKFLQKKKKKLQTELSLQNRMNRKEIKPSNFKGVLFFLKKEKQDKILAKQWTLPLLSGDIFQVGVGESFFCTTRAVHTDSKLHAHIVTDNFRTVTVLGLVSVHSTCPAMHGTRTLEKNDTAVLCRFGETRGHCLCVNTLEIRKQRKKSNILQKRMREKTNAPEAHAIINEMFWFFWHFKMQFLARCETISGRLAQAGHSKTFPWATFSESMHRMHQQTEAVCLFQKKAVSACRSISFTKKKPTLFWSWFFCAQLREIAWSLDFFSDTKSAPNQCHCM